MPRRFLAAALIAGLCLAALGRLPALGESVPTSVGTLYFERKNFREGDWVLYRLVEDSHLYGKRIRYQRIQAALEVDYRGEKCFWLETGFGTDPDSLLWSAVLVSEAIFEDSLADVHNQMYVRRVHVGRDLEGYPIAMPSKPMNMRRGLPDLTPYRPKLSEVGTETLRIGDRTFECRVVRGTREFARLRDLPDSTQRRIIEETTTRWYSPDMVPVTGMVRERARKFTRVATWPIGKPSTQFEPVVEEDVSMDLEIVDLGHGAKPRLAHRMRDAITANQDHDAPMFAPEPEPEH
jgi:hypothetical protein